jgi:hypothetical protein
MRFRINETQQNKTYYNAESRILFIGMLNVIMLSVIILC